MVPTKACPDIYSWFVGMGWYGSICIAGLVLGDTNFIMVGFSNLDLLWKNVSLKWIVMGPKLNLVAGEAMKN